MKVVSCLLIGTALAGAALAAPQAPAPGARVHVSSTRDPVDKSYRRMLAGMDERQSSPPVAALSAEAKTSLFTVEIGVT